VRSRGTSRCQWATGAKLVSLHARCVPAHCSVVRHAAAGGARLECAMSNGQRRCWRHNGRADCRSTPENRVMQRLQEQLSRRLLSHSIHLEPKGQGDNSRSRTRRRFPEAQRSGRRKTRAMVRARLPEAHFPAEYLSSRRNCARHRRLPELWHVRKAVIPSARSALVNDARQGHPATRGRDGRLRR
jgi:hypothetical protein